MSFERYMAQVIEVLQTPLERAREVRAVVGAPFEAPVFRAPQADLDEVNAGLQLAALAMEGVEDPVQAARLAMLCGAFVEEGGDAQLVSRAITRLATRSLLEMEAMLDALDPDGEAPFDVMEQLDAWPDAVKAWVSMGQLVVLPLMATLTRDAAALRAARADAALVRAASRFVDIIEEVYYVHALLTCVDELPLIVIEPSARRGWRVSVSGVRTCFHMFTLLKGALPCPAQADPELMAYARGEQMEGGTSYDEAAWDFIDGSGWARDDWREDCMERIVPGEMSPAEITRLDGEAVMLIRPVTMKRMWSAGFYAPLHEAHRSSVTVTATLGEEEVSAWLTQHATR